MGKTDCVNIEINEESCTCTATDCDRHGVCCECLRAHTGADGLPGCLRSKIQESQQYRDYLMGLIEQEAG